MSFIVCDEIGNQQIEAIPIAQINIFYDLYEQVAYQVGTNSFQLFVQGETGDWGILPSDNTQNYFIGCQSQISIIIVIVIQHDDLFKNNQQDKQQKKSDEQQEKQIQLIVFVDGQLALQSELPVEYPINQLILDFGNQQNPQIPLYFQSACDSTNHLINLDTNQCFSDYLQYQPLILNLTTQQDRQSEKKLSSELKQPSNKQIQPQHVQIESNENWEKTAFRSLIILNNVSIMINEQQDILVYKFHLPKKAKGSLSQEKSTINLINELDNNVDWFKKGKLKFLNLENGFAVKWENGNISKAEYIIQK